MTDVVRRLAALRSEPSRDDAGDPARLARVERTRSEMMTQGLAITATLQAEEARVETLVRLLRDRAIRRVVVAGCGDSWFIGAGVRHAVERLVGVPLEAAQALDYAAYGSATADQRTMVIGISASGETPAIVAALAAARQRGALTVGMSNRPDSPIVRDADAGLVVHATRRGWPTQSSTAAMALLIRLAERWAGKPSPAGSLGLETVAGLLDEIAADLDAPMATIAADLAAAPLILFAGLGPNYAAACIGAAKIRELAPIHAMAMPIEEYHHYRSQKRGDALILIATDPASQERAFDTALVSQAVGGRTVAILSGAGTEIAEHVAHVVRLPPVDPAVSALVSSVPLHLFAYHFAKARDALGLGAP